MIWETGTKYDPAGSKQWTRQFGTVDSDRGHGVSVDSNGNAYVTGYTSGSLDGNPNAGDQDMFVIKYDTYGSKLWTEQLGTNEWDYANGVSVDGSGNVYITGDTGGNLDGNINAGRGDMFLVKISTIPEPSTLILLATGAFGLLLHIRRKRR